MSYKNFLFFSFFAATSFLFTHCNNNSSAESFSTDDLHNSLIEEKHQLMNDLSENGALLIYGIENSSDSAKYKQIINDLKRNYWFPKVVIKRSDEVSENELPNQSIFLIGTFASNKVLQLMAEKLPVIFQKDKFYFNDEEFNKPQQNISFIYRNPYNHKKILLVFSGNKEEFVYNNLSFDLIGDVSISQNGERQMLGFWKYDDNQQWIIDNSSSKYFSKEKHELKISTNYQYIIHAADYDSHFILSETHRTDSLLANALQFFNQLEYKSNTKIHIYNSFEDKGLISGNTEMGSINPVDSSIHFVMNDFINGNDFSKNAALLAHHFLGEARTKFISEGLSIYLSDHWREKGYRFWAARIFLSGNLPPLKDLLNNDELNFTSYLIYQPLAGSFVSFLIDKYGKDYFLSNYSDWIIDLKSINSLENEWHSYLTKLSSDYKNEIDKNNWMSKLTLPTFQKGFCFAHVGYQIYNGYISSKAVESLIKMKQLGANSFSMTPFTYMRDSNKPIKLKYWEFAEGESIESMIHLMNAAKQLELTAMLKPHIYLGESNWPGAIEMNSEKDWDLFFKFYERWIMHYAMFAEMYHVPLFVIGNELSKSSFGHEKKWIELADKIRKIYRGKIIYAPNWGEEFEKLTFWSHFDYIGLSEYYPISSNDNPTDDELFDGARQVVERISQVQKKSKKPVIFTESGFRASAAPWKTALEKEGRDQLNLNNQARCYEALFKALQNNDWLKGIYWWKWPSYLEYKGYTFGEGFDLYSPNNELTEKVIGNWFAKF